MTTANGRPESRDTEDSSGMPGMTGMPTHAQRDGMDAPRNGASDHVFWRDHSMISLTPVAAPSILGFFGFAVAMFIVAANLAGWYGNALITPLVLFPFAFTFGGLAQLLAAMWAYRARDGLATGFHGAWGSFWLAYGIYMLLVGVGVAPALAVSADARVAFGYWFIGVAAVTWSGFAAALADNFSTALVLLLIAVGSTLLAIALTVSVAVLVTIGAIILVVSAIVAWYTATAMTMAAVTGRMVLPLGRVGVRDRIQYPVGEPGIALGQ
jgi:uncharacterized protein